MDRCAVFVDAGYLLAEGGKVHVSPSARRGDVAVDYSRVCEILAERAQRESGLPLLRIYWYDGAVDGVPTSEHLLVSQLPDVKLRLGRLSRGRQKGVDALVYRDLGVLARADAVAEAFLLAGDDDLREGVVWAQEAGVRVTLWGIGSRNQAPTLAAEADRCDSLSELGTCFSLASGSALAISEQPAPTSTDAGALAAVKETGRQHAHQWIELATPDEVAELLLQRPRIPNTLDAELLRHAQAEHGSLRGNDEARRTLRDGFWEGLEAARRGPSVA